MSLRDLFTPSRSITPTSRRRGWKNAAASA
jgi:hypothetical protein